MKCWTVNLIAAVWFNSYKRRLNVVTAGQLSSVESSVSYWRPEAVNQEEPAAIQQLRQEDIANEISEPPVMFLTFGGYIPRVDTKERECWSILD